MSAEENGLTLAKLRAAAKLLDEEKEAPDYVTIPPPRAITTQRQMTDLLRAVAKGDCEPLDALARIEAWADSYARRAVLAEREMVAQANKRVATNQS